MAGGICLHISFDFRTVFEIRGVFCGLIEFSLKIPQPEKEVSGTFVSIAVFKPTEPVLFRRKD